MEYIAKTLEKSSAVHVEEMAILPSERRGRKVEV